MSRRALLVIDVQQGLCDDGSSLCALDEVIARINALAVRARRT